MGELVLFWFRRDLRVHDNTGLNAAIKSGLPVLPLFIFDSEILDELDSDDSRVTFIYDQLKRIRESGVDILIKKGKPSDIFTELVKTYPVREVYCNRDYEPYAIKRDQQIAHLLEEQGLGFRHFKDQVIFEQDEVVKNDGKPYTVYTPYKNKWLEHYKTQDQRPKTQIRPKNKDLRLKFSRIPNPDSRFPIPNSRFPSLPDLGFKRSTIVVKPYTLESLGTYKDQRDFPALDAGSYLSVHLRFGTVSIREIVHKAVIRDQTFLEELIWREFFMQILWHFPEVVNHNFKRQYDEIVWSNNEEEFKKWCTGQTGYPMVDAGMRELNETGYMHNRVRMVTASFLCKHLLIDWRWGEAYFAKKLLDYELSSNNGNWQWAAGTGCDAAPYFRIFNPETQQKKFDSDGKYLLKWVPEYASLSYPDPMVNHKEARERALQTYQAGLQSTSS